MDTIICMRKVFVLGFVNFELPRKLIDWNLRDREILDISGISSSAERKTDLVLTSRTLEYGGEKRSWIGKSGDPKDDGLMLAFDPGIEKLQALS